MKKLSQSQLDDSNIDWPVYMEQALQLAGRVISARPNPRVGCVLLRDGKVIAQGWHAAAGRSHAEVMALDAAGADAAGCTAIVTLEPCAHHGRTGPCCDALVAAKVAKVVIAALDPNPQVSGRGVSRMEAGGIEVFQLTDFEAAARDINAGYFMRRELGRPRVTLKIAMSLDGRTAMASGESQWISSKEARADVQCLRARSSAVLTGINTLLTDDPKLTMRPEQLPLDPAQREDNQHGLKSQPLRVILDSHLRTPDTAKTLSEQGRVLIYAASGCDERALPGTEIVLVPAADRGVDLAAVLHSLAADYECNDVLVEAGAILSAEFIRQGLVDEMVVYLAPRLLGSDGRPMLALAGLENLASSIDFEIHAYELVGSDLKLTLLPKQG